VGEVEVVGRGVFSVGWVVVKVGRGVRGEAFFYWRFKLVFTGWWFGFFSPEGGIFSV
jgi:hypothetical protein